MQTNNDRGIPVGNLSFPSEQLKKIEGDLEKEAARLRVLIERAQARLDGIETAQMQLLGTLESFESLRRLPGISPTGPSPTTQEAPSTTEEAVFGGFKEMVSVPHLQREESVPVAEHARSVVIGAPGRYHSVADVSAAVAKISGREDSPKFRKAVRVGLDAAASKKTGRQIRKFRSGDTMVYQAINVRTASS